MEEKILFWAVWVGDYRVEWVGVTKETEKTFQYRGNEWTARGRGSKKKPLSFIRCSTEAQRDRVYNALAKMRKDQNAESRELNAKHTDERISLMAELNKALCDDD